MWFFTTLYHSYISSKIKILWRRYEAPYSYIMNKSWSPLSDILWPIMQSYVHSSWRKHATSTSCLMKEIFNFISVLYKFISILHKSYISPILYHIIWTHEIDTMLIKEKNNIYAQHNSKVEEYISLYHSHDSFKKKIDLIYNNKNINYLSFIDLCGIPLDLCTLAEKTGVLPYSLEWKRFFVVKGFLPLFII